MSLLMSGRAAAWQLDSSTALIGLYKSGTVRDVWTNPDNSLYQLPHSLWEASLRPDFKVQGESASSLTLVLRPRLRFEEAARSGSLSAYKRRESETEAYVSEGYLAYQPSDAWQLVGGLQNFQWGPAELASPSNPLFGELGLDKIAFYETRGKTLLRINYAPSATQSWVLIVEPGENGEDRAAFEESFHERVLLKAELSDASQTHYLGAVLAAAREEGSAFGLYGNWEALEAFTVYTDLLFRRDPRVWYPGSDPFAEGFGLGRPEQASRIQGSGVFGLRYVSESGNDLRFEIFHDSSAWTREERKRAFLTVFSQPTARTLDLFGRSGSLLPGRDFSYLSFRVPEFGWRKKQTVSLRALRSSSDGSLAGLALIEQQSSDHVTLAAGLELRQGQDTGELSQGYQHLFYAGGAYNW